MDSPADRAAIQEGNRIRGMDLPGPRDANGLPSVAAVREYDQQLRFEAASQKVAAAQATAA
eukprot:5784357-Heterocapsa_arctica.AAC.1